MKWQLPQEPNKPLLDDSRFEWFNRLWRHARGDTDWVAPTLLNSWVDAGGSLAVAGYRLKGGIVYGKGTVDTGTATGGTVIYTLPEGYRPEEDLEFVNISNGAVGQFDIQSDGDVVIQVGSNTSFALNYSFMAEQ